MTDDCSLQAVRLSGGCVDLNIASKAISEQQELIVSRIGFLLAVQQGLDRRAVIRWKSGRLVKDRVGVNRPLSNEIANAPAYQ